MTFSIHNKTKVGAAGCPASMNGSNKNQPVHLSSYKYVTHIHPQKKLDLHPITEKKRKSPSTSHILTQPKKITQLIVSPRHSGLCVLRSFEFLDVFRAGTAHLGREMRPEVGTDHPRNHVGTDHTPPCFAESPMAENDLQMGPDFLSTGGTWVQIFQRLPTDVLLHNFFHHLCGGWRAVT